MTKRTRSGFTLLETLLFVGIFIAISVAFVSVMVVVSRVYTRQSAVAEVNQQSQFLLQTIQYYVEQASLVDLPKDVATTTLTLRMASSSADPTTIYLSSSTIYIKQTAAGPAQALSTNKVLVTNLTFTKRVNAPGRDSVNVKFTLVYNTSHPQRRFSQSLAGAVARVNAATFDSNLVPSTANTFKIGVAAQDWQSINNTLFFSGSNVGVGVSTPGQKLEVNGGLRLNTTTAKPTCSVSQRGTLWITQSGAGTADLNEICSKNSSDAYVWTSVGGSSQWTTTPVGIYYNSGNVGIGTSYPSSTLHVVGGYLQFSQTSAGVPVGTDCDTDAERGRLVIDTTNNLLYVCNGATRGWDSITLSD